MFKAGTGHELFVVGGALVCRKCGSVATGYKEGVAIFGKCRGYCPEGSKGRRDHLLAGKCDYGWTVWPNGANKDIPIPPRRLFMKIRSVSTRFTPQESDPDDSEYEDSSAPPIMDKGPTQSTSEGILTQELCALLDEVEADITGSGECSVNFD